MSKWEGGNGGRRGGNGKKRGGEREGGGGTWEEEPVLSHRSAPVTMEHGAVF